MIIYDYYASIVHTDRIEAFQILRRFRSIQTPSCGSCERRQMATARPWWNVRFGPTELCFQATGGALQPEAPADAKKMCFPKMWRHCASVLMRGSGIMSINFIQFHRRFWSILSSGGHVNLHGKAHIWISHDSHDMFLLLAACWLGLGSSSAF